MANSFGPLTAPIPLNTAMSFHPIFGPEARSVPDDEVLELDCVFSDVCEKG